MSEEERIERDKEARILLPSELLLLRMVLQVVRHRYIDQRHEDISEEEVWSLRLESVESPSMKENQAAFRHVAC